MPTFHSIPTIVRAFKSAVTRNGTFFTRFEGRKIWQCNYYEHVIRSSEAFDRISSYIEANPLKWEKDRFFKENGMDIKIQDWTDFC